MGKKASVPSRQFTLEFKIEAVRLADSVGGSEAARRLGVPDSSMWNWIRLSREGKLQKLAGGAPQDTKRGPSELEAENSRLRRELANAQQDLEILKKAAAYFAKQSR